MVSRAYLRGMAGLLAFAGVAAAQGVNTPQGEPYYGVFGTDSTGMDSLGNYYGVDSQGNYYDANPWSNGTQGNAGRTPNSYQPNPFSFAVEPESLPAEIAEDIAAPASADTGAPRWGATPVDDVQALVNLLGLSQGLERMGLRLFGWVEGGYTYASTGDGLLSVEPRLNRFGDQYLLNQIGLTFQKPLRQEGFDWGFNVRYFAGADAALGQPLGGIDDPPGDPKFSHDFRDLNLQFHLPILVAGGMDVKVGRMNTIIGWNGFLAPYRPFYSSDYQFFYSQDGAFTGVLTNLHVSNRLNIWNGLTFGANTFFTKRSEDSICYIGQINYALSDERNTILTSSVYCGPDAIFAAPGLAGDFVTMVELRVQHRWSERFTQVVQSNMGWDRNTPVGTGSWYGLYSIGLWHLCPNLDLNSRAEWFQDSGGTRTGIDTDYVGITLGLNYHPNRFVEFRPELRGDFAGQPAFGGNNTAIYENQLTAASSVLFKF